MATGDAEGQALLARLQMLLVVAVRARRGSSHGVLQASPVAATRLTRRAPSQDDPATPPERLEAVLLRLHVFIEAQGASPQRNGCSFCVRLRLPLRRALPLSLPPRALCRRPRPHLASVNAPDRLGTRRGAAAAL